MNRENKRKTFTKNYYKTHACHDSFTCKVCGRALLAPTSLSTIIVPHFGGGCNMK